MENNLYTCKSIIALPETYTIMDLETTGLSFEYDEIIEVALLKVQDGKVVDSFSSLCKPTFEISDFVIGLTGITNEMLATAPPIMKFINDITDFIGEDIVVGHNVSFDMKFIFKACEKFSKKSFQNRYVDTMRIFRKLCPDLPHHRLKDLIKKYNLSGENQHRALADCYYTFHGYNILKELALTRYGCESNYCNSFKHAHRKCDLKSIVANCEPDTDNMFYQKRCVFTGTLSKFSREEAAQIVVNIGGICDNAVTKKTNFLIVGCNDYNPLVKDGKTTKQKKAEENLLNGCDISIITEKEFYTIIGEE